MSKLKNLSDGIAGRGNKEYIRLYPQIPITREAVLAFLYLVFGASAIYSVVLLVLGHYVLGLLILVTTIVNALWAVRDAKKQKWGDDETQ